MKTDICVNDLINGIKKHESDVLLAISNVIGIDTARQMLLELLTRKKFFHELNSFEQLRFDDQTEILFDVYEIIGLYEFISYEQHQCNFKME
ncbi:MAG: hypothetical protein KDH96_00565 [Candidatus Riesia sp.]|nr:hypothetical protein [Candidatus Riesia sp.]